MNISIDQESGFCFGVINAINTAEKYLKNNKSLYCLGDIVHNNEEVKRLSDMGLKVITHDEFKKLSHTQVLIRAHGEPPETYDIARKNHIQLIDATCPVVLNLQKNIKTTYKESEAKDKQILIFGKKGHAEVIGLAGQTENNGIIISNYEDIKQIDINRPATLYSQTTQSVEEYNHIISKIKEKYREAGHEEYFSQHDTICRLVANRSKHLQSFATQHDMIIFVSGEKSSNGLYLYQLCKRTNPRSYFISHIQQLRDLTIHPNDRIGICGATSTPMWLMEEIKEKLQNLK